MTPNLLIETNLSESVDVLTENVGGEKNYYIEGIMIQCNAKNRNGRVYLSQRTFPVVQQYKKDFVLTRRALGEMNHPDRLSVDPERASHLVIDLQERGDDIYGKAKIIGTPLGNIAKVLIDEKVRFGVSTRGAGSLIQRKGFQEVADDFSLTCIDIVYDPSAPKAFMNAIMEGKHWLNEGWTDKDIENARKIIKRTNLSNKEKTIVGLFEGFMNSLPPAERYS